MWVFDLEADSADLSLVTTIWCGVFKNIETNEYKVFRPGNIEEMIHWISEEQPTLIGHNIIDFDIPLMEKLYNLNHTGQIFDTLVISRLHQPNRISPPHCPNKKAPHSLEAWGYRVGYYKLEHEDWTQFSEEMLDRCAVDVEITHLVYKELLKESEGYDYNLAYKLTHKLFQILHKQKTYGWYIDQDKLYHNLYVLDRWKQKIKIKLEPYLPVLCIKEEKFDPDKGYSYVKKPFIRSGDYNKNVYKWLKKVGHHNIRGPFSRIEFRSISLDKPEELKDFLLKQGWEPAEWNENDKGERTSPKLTKSDPFKGITGKIGRLICKYVQCKHRESTLNGWITKDLRKDGKLPSVVTALATTGRAKHSVIVNIPGSESFFGKQMRSIFSCQPGRILVGCDAAGIQNRMLAARVGDPNFTKILLEGKKEDKTSIHFINQKAFADRGYDIGIRVCKNLNYGCLFGASNAKLGRMIGGTPEDGEQIREAILGVAPGFKQLVENLTEEWRSNAKVKQKWGKPQYHNGWIKGLDGRPIFIESEHQILVYMLQADEAIVMSAAYCYLYKWLIEKGYKWAEDWAYVNFNHDEYTIDCREELALEISILAEEAIYRAGRFYKVGCDQEGDAKIGCNWHEIH